ncbi:branched-chain amino acid ABC transporter permease/ATP-binding protein [Actinocorallia longicatena]|uniref:Branched-chain amino acid ABC transporter permease/ATP-binding protein n=1 Tax=Actinocorallia longicatena TaxID=111803 RepID=A0ABP6QG67_9ACTN
MIRFALLGLGTGAIYALIVQGMVIVYRGSGVLNFAQGAFAAVGALAYYDLRVHTGLPVPVVIVLALAASGAAGGLMHLLVMRPLRDAPPLTRVIATLGLMSALQQAGTILFGTSVRTVPSFLPTGGVHVAGTVVSADRLILLAIAAVVSAVLWLVYRFSRFGALTSAVAENERAAQLVGRSPDVIAAVNWILGCTLAGAAGILIIPIIGLNTDGLVLLVLPALAAAAVAGFDSFTISFAAAVAIGVVQSEITYYVDASGWDNAVPFLIVIIVLVVRGRPLPLRSHVNERLPEIGTGVLRPVPIALAAGAVVLLVLGTSDSWTDPFTVSILAGILCVSLVVVTGYAGQLSLAQYAFAGWGGYVAARLAAVYGLPFPLVLLIGVAAAVPVGIVIGLAALRTRGIHLAIATFGLAFSFQSVLFQSVPLTGGTEGTVVDSPSLFGWNIDTALHPKRYALVCLAALVLAALAAANIRRGRSGRRMVAVRGNERAAASLGISVYGAKLYAFALSAAIAGLGGVLLVFQSTFVDFSKFSVFNSIAVVINTVINGVGFLVGAALAGLSSVGGLATAIIGKVVTSGSVNQYVTLVLALLLVPTLIGFPNGLAARITTLRPPAFLRSRPSRPDAAEEAEAGRAASQVAPAQAHRVTPLVLEVSGVSVSFGGVHALTGVSVEVRPGEIVGVMGPNGAGKTTFIDAVTGFTRLRGGTILLGGERVDGMKPHRRARRGVGRTFQSLELFDQLTVLENLRTASDPRDPAAYLTDLLWPRKSALTPGARSAIAMFGLAEDFDRLPSELSYGRRRQVAIARAIAAEPSILLLDEPAAGLHETETAELGLMLRRLAEEWGIGILLVEHDVPLLNRVCDRIVAMDFGAVIATGTPQEIRKDQRVITAYLGEEHAIKEGAVGDAH